MIQLIPEQEHLRDTLFYAIFGESILMDTVETALAYRRDIMKKSNGMQRVPTIYCRTGDVISNVGSLDPSKKLSNRRAPLAFVFGQMPCKRRRQYMQAVEGAGIP